MVKIRRAYEVLALGLFLFFLVITDLRYLKGWPVSLFLEATPLVAVSTALTTHTIYRNLVWGLIVIAITMMLGRVWCNWMCPFGILHHFFGWIGNSKNTKQLIEVNRYKKIYAIKYYILAAMLAMAALWIIPTIWYAPGRIVHAYSASPPRPPGFNWREAVVALLITGAVVAALAKLIGMVPRLKAMSSIRGTMLA
ncbi:MAG TPA: 4Fe-4S binding protein, partial [Isosphaeraceae bacterium]